jgi:hypothetical protein
MNLCKSRSAGDRSRDRAVLRAGGTAAPITANAACLGTRGPRALSAFEAVDAGGRSVDVEDASARQH